MVRANGAEVFWEAQKKSWVVRIRVGEEVLRRTCKNTKRDSNDDELRTLAVETAMADGYELAAEQVAVKH